MWRPRTTTFFPLAVTRVQAPFRSVSGDFYSNEYSNHAPVKYFSSTDVMADVPDVTPVGAGDGTIVYRSVSTPENTPVSTPITTTISHYIYAPPGKPWLFLK